MLIETAKQKSIREYDNGYYQEKLEEGLQFQDVVTRALYQRGIVVVGYASKRFQNEQGENMMGAEIKRDGRFRETGNLYIEFEEFAELHIMLSRNLEYAPAAEELTYTAETMTKDLMREGLCGKGPKTVNCECSQIRITPDMDTREAQQLYNKLINCKAHEAGNNTNINISPEEAARAYRKFNEQCLIFAGNKQKNG